MNKVGDPLSLEAGSYFVIRDSDIFAAPALYAYAHLLQTMLEADGPRRFMTKTERKNLETLADKLVAQATEWQKRGTGKFPD